MNRQEFLSEFNRLGPEDDAGFAALAAKVRQDAREPVLAAVDALLKNDAAASGKAMRLLPEVGELAVGPLVEAATSDLGKKIWSARTAVNALGQLRDRVATLLDGMLADRRVVPAPAGAGPVEGKPPSPRVCDGAYLLMRQILNPKENLEQQALNQNAFLGLPVAEKDKEIQKARGAREWSELVGR